MSVFDTEGTEGGEVRRVGFTRRGVLRLFLLTVVSMSMLREEPQRVRASNFDVLFKRESFEFAEVCAIRLHVAG